MKIAIVKYNAGNIRSVHNALLRLGHEATITDNVDELRTADKVIFPGVGEAATTMECLNSTGLANVIRSLRQPVLGICLGMQLMCRHSAEGDVDCLGIFDAPVLRFAPPEPNPANLKIPHMGWNNLRDVKAPLFDESCNGQYVYFVHSYYVPLCQYTAATTDYTIAYSSALHKDNFFATQFHPEKSGTIGEHILKNFLSL